jgi:hypothetical protein
MPMPNFHLLPPEKNQGAQFEEHISLFLMEYEQGNRAVLYDILDGISQ